MFAMPRLPASASSSAPLGSAASVALIALSLVMAGAIWSPAHGQDADAGAGAGVGAAGRPDAALALHTKELERLARASDVDLERAVRAARKENRDVVKGLARLDRSEPGVADASAIVAALHGLAGVRSTEAIRALVRSALDHSGIFRFEVSELLSGLGERAVPALLLEWRIGSTPAIRRFAGAQLEAMEKRMPGEAIQTKTQEGLAEVLRAYGTAKDMDALGVVLSFTNADRDLAREASRAAMVDYGPLALGKLRESYASFMNRPAPDDWTAERVARELFSAYDRDRRKEMYVLLDDALGISKQAREKTPPDLALLEKAVEGFDKILARAPSIERRAEMVPAYVLLAQALETSAPERAGLLYRKAADLDPSSPRLPQIQAGLLALEAKSLRERGVNDEETLRQALALDPANALARAELDRIEHARGAREARVMNIGWMGAAAVGAGLLLLLFFALRRRFSG